MKKTLIWVLVVLLALGTCGGIFAFFNSSDVEEPDSSINIEKPKDDNQNDNETPVEPEVENYSLVMFDNEEAKFDEKNDIPSVITFNEEALSKKGKITVPIKSTYFPPEYENYPLTVKVHWLYNNKTEDISQYLSVNKMENDEYACELTCYKPFSGTAKLEYYIEGVMSDGAHIICSNTASDLDFDVEAERIVAENIKYYEFEVGNTYEFDVSAFNSYGEVNENVSFSVKISGEGNIITKDNNVELENNTVHWVEGTEQTLRLNQIKRVSPWIEEMFTVVVEGNKVKITPNATPVNYIVNQVAITETQIFCEDTFYAYENDNWYYCLTVYEDISEQGRSVYIRPVDKNLGV